MKIVCVGDAYITDDMMSNGLKPFLSNDDSLEVFFFGEHDQTVMRDVAKSLEAGNRETIAVPAGLHEAVADADLAERLDAKRASDAAAVLKKDAALQAELNQ